MLHYGVMEYAALQEARSPTTPQLPMTVLWLLNSCDRTSALVKAAEDANLIMKTRRTLQSLLINSIQE